MARDCDGNGQGQLAGDLLDFLSADLQPAPGCPTFREVLREWVWERLARERARRGSRPDPGH